jgi:hypothetical protein
VQAQHIDKSGVFVFIFQAGKGTVHTVLLEYAPHRSGLISKKELPKGKKASTWFNDWETVTEGDVLQNPLKSGDINGFYIYPQMNEEGTAPTSDYNNYSYYFVINGKNNVSEYVLEGVCIDENSAAAFPGIMDECIKNIKVK